jgi:hypothetical protein
VNIFADEHIFNNQEHFSILSFGETLSFLIFAKRMLEVQTPKSREPAKEIGYTITAHVC